MTMLSFGGVVATDDQKAAFRAAIGVVDNFVTLAAAQAIGGHRVVIASGAGAADYADASDPTHAGRVVGLTTNAAAAGGALRIQSQGPLIEPSWSWTPGGDVWLDTAGQLTQTAPTSRAFLQRLGFATSATAVWIELAEPVLL